MIRTFVLALLFCPVLAFAQALNPSQALDSIVAVVEEDVILRSELDRELETVLAQFADRPQQLPPRPVLERQVLERLIMTRLQVQRAEAGGIRVGDSELDAAVANMAQSNNMTITQLRQVIENDGLSFAEFRERMRERITIDRLQQGLVRSRVEVTDTEIDILLASDQLRSGEVRLGHILVAVPDGSDSNQVRIAREKVDGVARLIAEGMDFSAAAVRYSDASQALEGGDLGWRAYEQLPPFFADTVVAMEPGQVAQLIRSPAGFHLLKVIDRREQGAVMVQEYKARHIMTRVTELVDANTALANIRRARDRVQSGEEFSAVARQMSEDETSAPLGGDLGWFQADAFGQRVGQVVQSLRTGELSEPFRSDSGWHLILLEDSRVMDRTADARRMQAEEAIFARKGEEEYDSFLRQLRADAYIENRLVDRQG